MHEGEKKGEREDPFSCKAYSPNGSKWLIKYLQVCYKRKVHGDIVGYIGALI